MTIRRPRQWLGLTVNLAGMALGTQNLLLWMRHASA
jgi:hypothetical protein